MKNIGKLISSLSNLKLMPSALISIALAFIFVFFSTLIDYEVKPSQYNVEADLNRLYGSDNKKQEAKPSKYNMDEIFGDSLPSLEPEVKKKSECNEYDCLLTSKDVESCNAHNNYGCGIEKTSLIDFMASNVLLENIGIVALGIFIFISLIRAYSTEKSYGWKRLSIILSLIIAPFIPTYFSDDYDHGLPIILISFPPTLLIVLLLKRIYLWIKDGFEKDNETSIQSDLKDDESKNNKLKLKIFEPKKIDENQKHEDLLKLRSASFSNRFFARSIDLAFVFGLTIYTIYLLAKIPDFGNDSAIFSIIVAVIVLNLASFCYEYICLILFEASLGKVIFNMVVVTKECQSLNNNDCVDRSWKIIKNCFGFFMIFPLLQMYLTLKARNNFKKDQSTSYDKNTYLVKQRPISLLRWISSVTLAIILLFSSLVVVEMLKK